MTDETDENKLHRNSQDILNKNLRNHIDTNSLNIQLSNNSKKNEEEEEPSNITNDTFIDQFSNEIQITHRSISPNEINNLNREEPTSFNKNLFSSQNEQNQIKQTEFSINFRTTDENRKSSRPQSTTSIRSNDQQKTNMKIMDKQEFDNTYEKSKNTNPLCQFYTDKKWVNLQWHDEDKIKTPEDLENDIEDPPDEIDENLLDRIKGSLIGMALGDALGAHVEFRPREYMKKNPVKRLEGGGTWGLKVGQFTDDTSMGLCLANSLIARCDFIPYDQLVRYKWWFKTGYMSSTGQCFDIGAATSQSIREFEIRQKKFAKKHKIHIEEMDRLSDRELLGEFDVYCSEDGVAGNGALMRMAPVPLFFYRNKYAAIEFSGRSGLITHGDKKVYDACRFYGALIVAALRGMTKKEILAHNFYSEHKHWFGEEDLHESIKEIAEGSYKRKRNYSGGIRGKGYIVNALEAALWAFWSDGNSFEKGALNAVNLGDDTDTTAAIYGQLAGAYYGYKKLPKEWVKDVYAHKYLEQLSKWIEYEGKQWESNRRKSFSKK